MNKIGQRSAGHPENPLGPDNHFTEKGAGSDPFKSNIFSQYYFSPFRPSTLKGIVPVKSVVKWANNKIRSKSANPLKSSSYIHSRLSPPYVNANTLSVDQCGQYAKQAYICRASMNLRATYERSQHSRNADYLSGITNLNGGYDVNGTESSASIRHLKQVSREAKTFFDEVFPASVRAVIEKGRGSFIDKNTGLCVTFLYENPPGATKPTIHVVFPGTGAGQNLMNNLSTDVAMLINANHVPPSFVQARNILQMVKAFAGERANIEAKGFSLGGSIAAYAGICNEVSTTTLCPLPLSPTVWKSLIEEKGEELENLVMENVTNLAIEGDISSGHKGISDISRKIESRLSLSMPHILGTTYIVSGKDLPENHTRIAIGYGTHSASAKLWSDFYNKKKLAEQNTTDSKAEIISKTRESDQETVDPTASEYSFLIALDKFSLSIINRQMRLLSPTISEVAKSFNHFRSSYETKSKSGKLAMLIDLEKQIFQVRNGNLVESLQPAIRKLYRAVASERNRLQEPPPGGWPIESLSISIPVSQSANLLGGISAVAQNAEGEHTIHRNLVESSKNAIFPRVLQTGDEIAPAAYALIRNAEKKVQLQTYLYYEKSDSAKWLHKALDELQQKQLEKRKTGESVSPIEVEIILDDSRGLAKQDLPGDGGRFQTSRWTKGRTEIPRKNEVSNYGIGYPSKLDPSLVRLTVKGIKHHARGSLHSKTILVDDKFALVSTNNFKGTHHKISMDGLARFDAGIIFSGEASQAIRDDFSTVGKKYASKILGSNLSESVIGPENESQFFLSSEHQPAAHAFDQLKPWQWNGFNHSDELSEVMRIVSEVEEFRKVDAFENNLKMAVISRAPNNSLYSKTDDSPQRAAYLHALKSAKCFVRITNVNLNVPEVIDALVAATKRGVRVEILLPDDSLEILSAIDAKTNFQAYSELQKKVDEIDNGHLLDLRWQASSIGRMPDKGAKNHTKYMNVDGVAILGSTNLDIQSWKYSSELSVATADPETVQRLDSACFVQLFQSGIPFMPRKDAEMNNLLAPPNTEENLQAPRSKPTKQGRLPGHAGTLITLDDNRVAKLTSAKEAETYREFGAALAGAICRYQPHTDDLRNSIPEEKRVALSGLEAKKRPGQEIIILDRIGSEIAKKNRRELDIKVGQENSYSLKAEEDGRPKAFKKYVKRAMFSYATRTTSILGSGRHYRMVGANHHGFQLKGGRTMVAHRTKRYLTQTLDLPEKHRTANIEKIRQDLELIRQKVAGAPVAFIGCSVLIAIDENNPDNTEVKLIDLAHPVSKDDPEKKAIYADAARLFERGISNLIDECSRLQENNTGP